MEKKIRQGFLEHGDFVRLITNLPDHLRDVIEFLYLSGWRKGEALTLEWRDVDLEGQAIRLRIENSKNKESRLLPLTGRLFEIVQKRKTLRRLNCVYVFHQDGRRIKEFRETWKAACVAAGVGRLEQNPVTKKKTYRGTIVHDLRRCAARNLSRAGVPEAIAMQLTGHKTSSMYRRYRIVPRTICAKPRKHFRRIWEHIPSCRETGSHMPTGPKPDKSGKENWPNVQVIDLMVVAEGLEPPASRM